MAELDPSIPEDVAALNFEDALAELEGIVQRLEQGKGALDEAIDAYERGSALRRHCEAKLADAKERVERISLAGGVPKTQPFDVE
ncbi:MAG: exodeoxyribonuclease VII small subunit [Alphaproteobacteria bacterium]|jgi:exodeoxyribonuclease VII small subunit